VDLFKTKQLVVNLLRQKLCLKKDTQVLVNALNRSASAESILTLLPPAILQQIKETMLKKVLEVGR